MNKDIKRWVQACIPCQRTKVHRHTRLHPSQFPVPDSRFAHIHTDLTRQHTGLQADSNDCHQPASNGLVERFHRQLKVALRAAPETPWPEVLPLALLGIRSTFKADMGCAVAEMVYGTSLRLPGDLVCALPCSTALPPADYVSRLRRTIAALRPATSRPSRVPPAFQHPDLASCTHVFVRCDAVWKPLQPPYSGPHLVLRRSPNFYTIQLNGREGTVALEQLNPAYVDAAPPLPPSFSVELLHDSPSTATCPLTTPTTLPLASPTQTTPTSHLGSQARFYSPASSAWLRGRPCGGIASAITSRRDPNNTLDNT
ncbi:uncharacterized protein LOC135400401 [Ornithodoros turicata]|uniref:uncharacterized protein LOC135400401 n=1 Tax=Ornithodoros turicata TaxID=34597 RepID=UPI003139DCEC